MSRSRNAARVNSPSGVSAGQNVRPLIDPLAVASLARTGWRRFRRLGDLPVGKALHLHAAAARRARASTRARWPGSCPGKRAGSRGEGAALTGPETVRQHLHLAEAASGGLNLIPLFH